MPDYQCFMNKELFFDIVSDEWAGGLYRLNDDKGNKSFYYHRSSSDLDEDKNTNAVIENNYNSFTEFWAEFIKDNRWFTLHPLYIHPDQRPFIKEELKNVNWKVVTDEKWRDMYQRQWNKVLTNPASYYQPANR